MERKKSSLCFLYAHNVSFADQDIVEQSGQNPRGGIDARTGIAHMEHKSVNVQRRAADHLLGVAVVEPVRNRIAGQVVTFARAVVFAGHPFGHRQTR